MTEEKNQEIQDKNLQRYELVYLISNKFSESELEPITNSVIKLIKDNGGNIINEENWGKRKLSYPIEHFFNAYYIIVEFELIPEATQKIEKHLRLSEEILRHLIVVKRVKTQEEIEHEQKIAKERAEQQAERIAERVKEKEGGPTVKPKAEKEEKKKIDIKELNEKLDKILDDTGSLL